MGSAEAGQQKGCGLYLYRIMKIPGRYLLSEESGYLFFVQGKPWICQRVCRVCVYKKRIHRSISRKEKMDDTGTIF